MSIINLSIQVNDTIHYKEALNAAQWMRTPTEIFYLNLKKVQGMDDK